jgi:protein involved in polysaccharide export with SLBB domain
MIQGFLIRRYGIHAAAIMLVLAAMAAPIGAQSTGQPATPNASAMPSLILNPGDAVRITVWQNEAMSGEFVVSADGTIADPFYMEVSVAGVPFPTAVDRVRAHLREYAVSPRVLVEPLFRVAVGGEVRQPSLYSLRPETSVAQAVMLAGGPTERARLSKVRLLRDQQEIRIDLTAPQAAQASMAIRSGDVIIIPRRSAIIRDFVAPVSSVTSAVVSIAYLLTRYF